MNRDSNQDIGEHKHGHDRKPKPERDLVEWNVNPRGGFEVVNLGLRQVEDAARHTSAASVLASDEFKAACAKAKIKPTHKQALKWISGRGAAYKAKVEERATS